jgi:hypothetical protein
MNRFDAMLMFVTAFCYCYIVLQANNLSPRTCTKTLLESLLVFDPRLKYLEVIFFS